MGKQAYRRFCVCFLVALKAVLSQGQDMSQWQLVQTKNKLAGRSECGLATVDNKLDLVNGIQYGHSSGTTNMFDEYDPATGHRRIMPDAPHIRDHSMAAVAGDKLYAVGGRNTSYHEPDNFMAFMSKTVTEVDCFAFKTGQWSTLPARLPLGSGGGTLVAVDEKLYYMGGERATATTPNGPQKETY